MKILHIGKFYPPHRGGMETHLELLCRELRRHLDIRVVVANDGPATVQERIDDVVVTRAGTLFHLSAAPISPGMCRVIRSCAADVVHIHWPNPMAVMAYLASRHPAPLVLTYHSDVVRQKVMAKMFGPLLERVLKQSGAIIISSPEYAASSPVLSRFRERCRLIPFGISLARYEGCDHAAVDSIRARWGPRLVLGVGRHVYYKGFEYLIRAMQRVDAKAVLVGDGPLRSRLEALARSCGVADRVAFLGEVDEVIPYYHAADVFVLPSVARSEAFGLVQLEAMACGKPVVNTQIDSGVPSVSVGGVTGLTVPPADGETLAGAINLLLDNPGLRARYGEAARQRVREEFSANVMAHRTLHLYEEISAMFPQRRRCGTAV